MQKALRIIKERVTSINAFIEIIDARLPYSTHNS
jgi:ribosome biogenesis GTPase A